MIRVFGVDDRQLVFSAKFIRRSANLRHIGFPIAVIFLAIYSADRVPNNMRMDMPGVQVGADDIFIPPAQYAVCQFLCDLVRQFGGDFSCSEALHKVIPLHTAQLVPVLFCLPHIGKGGFQCAGIRAFKAGLLCFVAVGGIVEGILQGYRRGLFLIHHILHCPIQTADRDHGCVSHIS